MKTILSVAAMTATLATCATAHAAQFVVNGDFTQLSWTLMLVGLGGLGALARRRAASAVAA